MGIFKKINKYMKRKNKLLKELQDLPGSFRYLDERVDVVSKMIKGAFDGFDRKILEQVKSHTHISLDKFRTEILSLINEGLSTIKHPGDHLLELIQKEQISLSNRIAKLEKTTSSIDKND